MRFIDMPAPYTDWDEVLDGNGTVTVSTTTQFSRNNKDGTVTTFHGTGFAYTAGEITGGTIASIERSEGATTVTQVTGISQPVTDVMDIFGAADSALAAAITWKNLFKEDNNPLFTATEISLENTDGSKTVFVGTGFSATGGGNLFTGTVNTVEHRAANGTVITSVATGGVSTYFAVAAVFDDGGSMGLEYLRQGDNTVTGLAGLDGGAGNDTITGTANFDWINGEAGDDILTGLGGVDVFEVDDPGFGDDVITDFDLGHEIVLFSSWSQVSSMSQLSFADNASGHVVVSSSQGSVTLQGVSAAQAQAMPTAFVFDKEFNGPVTFTTGDDGVYLGHYFGGGIIYNALAGNDHVIGGFNNDTIAGGDGNDVLGGGYGDDTLSGDTGNDFVEGGEGNDSLGGGDGVDFVIGMWGNDTLDGGAGRDYLNGGEGDDSYTVDDTYDVVDEGFVIPQYGFGGNDTLISKTDWFWDYYGVGDTVRIDESVSGADSTIVAGIWDNHIYGNTGTNVMFGRGGSDTYHPGAGIDFISFSTLGLTDANAYAGVNGVNTLVMEQGNSYDIIFEFESGRDKVDLTAFGLTSYAALQALGHDDGIGNSYYVLGTTGLDYLYLVGLELADVSAGDFLLT
jgi:Ca2+-binding RTX toxin-like protein